MANKYLHPFGKLAKNYRKFRSELTTVASSIAENEFTENFGRNSVGGYRDGSTFTAWQKRKSIAGKRDSKRSVLVKSGRMRRSFAKRPTLAYARVVNTAPYAKIHNEGGQISGEFKVRSHSRRTRKGNVNVSAHSRNVNTNMPKRPFMVTNKNIIDAIDNHVSKSLNKIFNESL